MVMLAQQTLDFVPAPVLEMFTKSLSGRTFAVRNPATGEVIAQAADCGADDARRAHALTSS